MDINLTSPVVANVSLMQPWYNTLINASAGAIGGLVTGMISFVGVFFTINYYKNKDEQTRNNERKIERRNAYIQLSSQKRLPQLYLSRFESRVLSRYHLIAKIQEKQKTSTEDAEFHMEQQIYWMHRGNELNDRLYLEEKRLFELIGSISTIFPKTDELTTRIDRIYKTPTLTLIPLYAMPNTLEQLESWKENARRELDDKVKIEYLQPIDDLLDYLNEYLENDPLEEAKAKSWWQFWR